MAELTSNQVLAQLTSKSWIPISLTIDNEASYTLKRTVFVRMGGSQSYMDYSDNDEAYIGEYEVFSELPIENIRAISGIGDKYRGGSFTKQTLSTDPTYQGILQMGWDYQQVSRPEYGNGNENVELEITFKPITIKGPAKNSLISAAFCEIPYEDDDNGEAIKYLPTYSRSPIYLDAMRLDPSGSYEWGMYNDAKNTYSPQYYIYNNLFSRNASSSMLYLVNATTDRIEDMGGGSEYSIKTTKVYIHFPKNFKIITGD